MILPHEVATRIPGERFIAAREHGDGYEELQVRVMITGNREKLEIRNWTRAANGARVPSRHGVIAPLNIIPWLIETLSKINPAESNSTENLRNKIQ